MRFFHRHEGDMCEGRMGGRRGHGGRHGDGHGHAGRRHGHGCERQHPRGDNRERLERFALGRPVGRGPEGHEAAQVASRETAAGVCPLCKRRCDLAEPGCAHGGAFAAEHQAGGNSHGK